MQTYSALLSAYIDRDGNTEADLAAKINRTQPAVHRYRKGVRFCDAETARLIETATGGAVPFEAWRAEFMSRSGMGQAA